MSQLPAYAALLAYFVAQYVFPTVVPTGTLLLIDDEASLRQAIARMLELEGSTDQPLPAGWQPDLRNTENRAIVSVIFWL